MSTSISPSLLPVLSMSELCCDLSMTVMVVAAPFSCSFRRVSSAAVCCKTIQSAFFVFSRNIFPFQYSPI
jgi:hypothetical protein